MHWRKPGIPSNVLEGRRVSAVHVAANSCCHITLAPSRVSAEICRLLEMNLLRTGKTNIVTLLGSGNGAAFSCQSLNYLRFLVQEHS